ncbi:response regulator [Planctomycetota bacterium]
MKLNLPIKITVLIIAVLFITVVLFSIIALQQQKKILEDEFLVEKKAMTEIAAIGASSALLQFNVAFFEDMVKAIMDQKDIVYCRLVKDTGEIYMADDKALGGKVLKDEAVKTQETLIRDDPLFGDQGETKVVITPMHAGSWHWTLWIGFSTKSLCLVQTKMVYRYLLLGLIVVLVGFLVAFLFAKHITNPIKRLLTGFKTVAEGDFSCQINIKTNDEFRELGDHFNQMTKNLQRYKNQVAAYDKDLEQKIQKGLEQLHEAQEHARRVGKLAALGQLAGGVAHDFNNILTSITGRVSLIKRKMEESHPLYHDLDMIEKSTNRAATLTQQLLGFARKGKYRHEAIKFSEIIKDIFDLCRETFNRNISIQQQVQEDLWSIEGDSSQLHECLFNLCLNARDAMPNGGQLIIRVENLIIKEGIPLKSYPGVKIMPGDYLLFSVTDTGVGMSPETQVRIFEPFFTTKAVGQGTGMGLAMVYGVVKNHKGFIDSESTIGKGSIFRLYFPASREVVITKPSKPVKEPKEKFYGTETVLLVDDEEDVRDVGQRMLEENGYRVILAKEGKEACEIYQQKNDEINLVILDLIMPMLSGEDTYAKLKDINPTVKVLLISGYDNSMAQNMLEAGAHEFVQKPFNVDKLAKSVRRILDIK